jgi:hypothetical protein
METNPGKKALQVEFFVTLIPASNPGKKALRGGVSLLPFGMQNCTKLNKGLLHSALHSTSLCTLH